MGPATLDNTRVDDTNQVALDSAQTYSSSCACVAAHRDAQKRRQLPRTEGGYPEAQKRHVHNGATSVGDARTPHLLLARVPSPRCAPPSLQACAASATPSAPHRGTALRASCRSSVVSAPTPRCACDIFDRDNFTEAGQSSGTCDATRFHMCTTCTPLQPVEQVFTSGGIRLAAVQTGGSFAELVSV